MATNLKDFCKNIADSIRAKEGSSDLISPMDFAQRIDALTVGGGTSESSIEYLDVRDNITALDILAGGIEEMNVTTENAPIPIEGVIGLGTAVLPLVTELRQMGATVNIIAISYNRDAITMMKQDGVVITQTAYEQLVSKGESYVEAYNNLPRITKEQFYDLTT